MTEVKKYLTQVQLFCPLLMEVRYIFFVRIDRSSVFTMGCVSWRKFLRKQEEIKLRKLSPWYKGVTNWRRFLLIPFVPNFHNWGNISVPHFPHFDIEQILPIRYVRVSATFSRAYISWGGWRWWWRVERRRSRSCTMCSRRPSSHRGCNGMVFHGQGIFSEEEKNTWGQPAAIVGRGHIGHQHHGDAHCWYFASPRNATRPDPQGCLCCSQGLQGFPRTQQLYTEHRWLVIVKHWWGDLRIV